MIEAIGSAQKRLCPNAGHRAAVGEAASRRSSRSTATPTAKCSSPAAPAAGLLLAMMALVNPGDEVIVFDPYFVTYEPLVKLMGGRAVLVDTYPDFTIDLEQSCAPRSRRAPKPFCSTARPIPPASWPRRPKCKASPSWPPKQEHRPDQRRNLQPVLLRRFVRFAGQVQRRTIVVDGFSKTYAMTGWRVGFAHGPADVIEAMIKLQQYTFVCAPQPAQWACVAALDIDIQALHRRLPPQAAIMLLDGLGDLYEIARPRRRVLHFPESPRRLGHRHASSSNGPSTTSCSSSPARSSAAATPISAFLTPRRPKNHRAAASKSSANSQKNNFVRIKTGGFLPLRKL